MNQSSSKDEQANNGSVLRAADVIPPFSEGPSQRRDVEARPGSSVSEGSGLQAARDAAGHRRSRKSRAGHTPKGKSGQPAARPEIPQYDLGEHILAEHREATARKRRAPAEPDPKSQEPMRVRTHIPMAGASEQELRDLQTIVTEIVARDIARLSRGVAPAAYE